MTDNDLKRLEAELGFKLPTAYGNLMRAFPAELRDALAGTKYAEYVIDDVDKVLALNRDARKQFRRAVRRRGFVFGRSGASLWMLNAAEGDNPPVEIIRDGDAFTVMADLQSLLNQLKAAQQQAGAGAPSAKGPAASGTQAKPTAKAASKPAPARPAPAKTTPTSDDLIAEGRRLARPALLLTDEGKKCIAIWKGGGVLKPSPGPWRHWISLDAGALPDNPRKLTGVISVYEWFEDSERLGEIGVVHDPAAKLPRKTDGQRLFGEPFQCLPHADALLYNASAKIKQWLKERGWNPKSGDSPGAYADKDIVEPYRQLFFREHPVYTEAGLAMFGGWSIDFDDDWLKWSKKPLVVLTVADSEPWVEVFDDGRKLVGFGRIT